MRRARVRQDGNILGVAPFLVDHETNSTTFGFYSLCCSVHPPNKEVIGRRHSRVWSRGHESGFRKTKDITVPNITLETYPGSKIKDWTLASRILGRGGLCALFLNMLRTLVRFPLCFLLCLLGGGKFEDKVSQNRSVQQCPISKSVNLS